MVTYHPHCGDQVPGLTAAATLLVIIFGVMLGVPDPFPPDSKPVSASTTAAPPAGAPACGTQPANPSAHEWGVVKYNEWRQGERGKAESRPKQLGCSGRQAGTAFGRSEM